MPDCKDLRQSVWTHCYEDSWKGLFGSEESFSHPAKFSRGLIRRIYEHLHDQYGLQPGAVVVDPFGGIGCGCLDAMQMGFTWVSCELEPRFVDLATGFDCDGHVETHEETEVVPAKPARSGGWTVHLHIEAAYWGRDGIKRIDEDEGELFPTEAEAAAFADQLFATQDHWNREAYTVFYRDLEPEVPEWTFVKIVCDKPAQCGKTERHDAHHITGNLEKWQRYFPDATARMVCGDSRRLRECVGPALAEVVLSSPPYLEGGQGFGSDLHPERSIGMCNQKSAKSGNAFRGGYGTSPGQLGAMPAGSVDAILSSPPYAETLKGNGTQAETAAESQAKRQTPGGSLGQSQRTQGYGSKGNLGNLAAGCVDAVVASPPYHTTLDPTGNRIDYAKVQEGGRNRTNARDAAGGGYGDSPSNLASLPPGSVDAACGADAIVASPPFCDTEPFKDKSFRPNQSEQYTKDKYEHRGFLDPEYAENAKTRSLSSFRNPTDTFWSAALEIVRESFAILRPGGLAVWVTKRFVRDGKIVEFSQDWERLCQSVGFETIEWVRASLVSREEHPGLFGEPIQKEKARLSFFRRLHQKKYPHLAIEWEDVIFMRKAAA